MIKLIKSSFYREKETKRKLANFVLKTKIFSMNKECAKFEKNFAKKQKRKYAVFVSSGSNANLVLIQALLNLGKLKPGDQIGFSALTWPTNVMPLIQFGLRPLALDCDLRTLNVSPDELEKNISKIKGLFLTNVLGLADNIQKIKTLCHKHKIIFIEDNCESLGSKVNGTLLGNFGLASTFSFFVGHHLSAIEGGMICTDDQDLYRMLVMSRAHGWDRNLSSQDQQKLRQNNHINDFYAKYAFYDLAFNVRPTEINGFLGNDQLKYWDEIVAKRAKNFKFFQAVIKKNDDFLPLAVKHLNLISSFAVPVICRDKKIMEKYQHRFIKGGVEIRPIIAGNIVRQPFYEKYFTGRHHCPNADFVHDSGFYFPNNPELTDREINALAKLLKR